MEAVNPADSVSVDEEWLWKWDKHLTNYIPGGNHFKDITGIVYGNLTALYPVESDKVFVKWMFECSCGNKVVRSGADARIGKLKSCGCHTRCANNASWQGYEEMSGAYLRSIKNGAITRKLVYDIDPKYIWDLFIKQDRKCALSGQFLVFKHYPGDKTIQTASLDRIDSTKGYTHDNVQWVHKDVNNIKSKFSEDYFIELCCLIADRARKENTIERTF